MGYSYVKNYSLFFCNSDLIGHFVFRFAKFDTLGGVNIATGIRNKWNNLEFKTERAEEMAQSVKCLFTSTKT